ncbi:NAD-dependent epimerase/dehydratase family protein [Fulvivirgaceae bacterium PWU4]|uniref:NAD-dependent epimerase/dehydratase family protein n=1 Tax=Chryseosolibacter histidini TaxID=2782349 RepID=A0AAP2DHA8_9BACT|nr:NAD-dependent epimerase/dehydratase family protein [Chryseosolibacter histidini]MBT1696378.1 NAD-dependent epimerase/dehydratase family protein [Chryseosolibacter histidini]
MDTAKKIKVIVTGVTGMVGEGVMHECLQHPQVESVLVINRRPCGVTHPKLKEIIHQDFLNFAPIESQLSGYDACYFCLGISSVGVDKDTYYKMTYTLTLHVAETLSRQNKGMTFCYVSGKSTDSTEKGGLMWARVKGKTENDLMKLPFKQVFAFRPGFMKPTEGLKNALKAYRYMGRLYPIGRALFPNAFCTLKDVGIAMIHTTTLGYEKRILEVQDIVALANRSRQ